MTFYSEISSKFSCCFMKLVYHTSMFILINLLILKVTNIIFVRCIEGSTYISLSKFFYNQIKIWIPQRYQIKYTIQTLPKLRHISLRISIFQYSLLHPHEEKKKQTQYALPLVIFISCDIAKEAYFKKQYICTPKAIFTVVWNSTHIVLLPISIYRESATY